MNVVTKFEDDLSAAAADASFTETSRLVGSLQEADAVLLVDVANLAWRVASAPGNAELMTSTGLRSGHVFGALRSLIALFENVLEPRKWLLVRCNEGQGAKEWRRQWAPGYKGNRDPNRWNPVDDVVAALKLLPGCDVERVAREGDDAIAAAAQKFRMVRPVVYSGDRDLWALLQRDIQVYSPNLARMVTGDDLRAKFSLSTPEKLPLLKALCGDSSDYLTGVDRFRKAVAGAAIDKPHVVDVETLYAELEKGKLSAKTAVKLALGRAAVEANFKATTLHPEGFGSEHFQFTPGDPSALAALLERYECKSLMKHTPALSGRGEFTVWGRSD